MLNKKDETTCAKCGANVVMDSKNGRILCI